MNYDLTTGKPEKQIFLFTLPLFASSIFQQLYNLADSFIAGNFIGQDAIAAVGNSYEITLIFLAFATGCNIGCSVIVSQLFGAKRLHDMRTAVYTTFVSTAVLALVLTVLGFIFSPAILRLIDTPEVLFEDSLAYIYIYTGGLMFLFIYNITTGIFSAMGDSKTPFIFLAVSSLSNILLDIVFVIVFNMGVPGVAWATFICQGICCLISLTVLLTRLHKIKDTENDPAPIRIFSFAMLKSILKMAIPSIIQQSCISLGNMVVQKVVNGYGPDVIAGYSAAIKINNMLLLSFNTCASGAATFVSQNAGARKYDRVRMAYKPAIKMMWVLALPAVILFLLAGDKLIGLFINDPTDYAVQSGFEFLKMVSPFYFVITVKFALDSIFRGLGKVNYFMVSTFTDLIIRAVLVVIFSALIGKPFGIWLSWPIGWILGTGVAVFLFIFGKWRTYEFSINS